MSQEEDGVGVGVSPPPAHEPGPPAHEPGHPQEELEVDDGPPEDDAAYPTGIRLWMAVASMFTMSILYGLDLTIVAATIPSVTNQFRTVEDIGWYSSAYSVMMASFGFLFGKLYGLVRVKRLYLVALGIFELGSLLCTVAPTSWFFILGRAVAGVGGAGVQSGTVVVLSQCFPRHRRALWTALVSASQMIGIVSSPVIGGVLIDWISWRGCFGINLPLGAAAALLLLFGFRDLVVSPDAGLPWREKLRRFDILGTVFMAPSVTCLLLALQWGGIRYGWGDVRIVVLFVLSAVLLAVFAWRQHRLQEAATLPPRIIRMRSVLAGTWYSSCCNSILSVTEYYMTIYFQGVKGYTATRSGVLLLPLLVGIAVGGLCGGAGTTRLGYHNRRSTEATIVTRPCSHDPAFMISTTVLAPVASGLLTTVGLDDQLVKVLCLLGFLGVAVGLGLNTPIVALQTTMKDADLPLGIASLAFGATMGSAVWIVVSAALFQNRLAAEMAIYSPTINSSLLDNVGLSDIRSIVGSDRLRDVLLGYDEAVTQTLYLPVGLCVATILGSALFEWQSVKKKTS